MRLIMDAIKNCLFVVLPIASLAYLWNVLRNPLGKQGWRDSYAAMRSRRISGTHALFPIAMAVSYAWLTVLGGEAGQATAESPWINLVAAFTLVPVTLASAVFLPLIAEGKRAGDAFGPLEVRKRDIARGIRWGLAMVLPLALAGIAATKVSRMFGSEPVRQTGLTILSAHGTAQWKKLFLLFSALVLAPVTEELAFRGVVLAAVAKRRGIVAAVALTSVFFGAIHCNLDAFLTLSLAGACFALGYIASGRITVPIAMHATFNAASIILNLIAD